METAQNLILQNTVLVSSLCLADAIHRLLDSFITVKIQMVAEGETKKPMQGDAQFPGIFRKSINSY